MILFRLFVIAIAFAMAGVAVADTSTTIRVNSSTKSLSLDGHVAKFIDKSGSLSVEQIKTVRFSAVSNLRNPGYTFDTHWYRFSIELDSDAPREWILSLGDSFLDDVHVWVFFTGGNFQEFRLGDHFPFKNRTLSTRRLAVPLNFTDNPIATVYIRVNSTSNLKLEPEIWTTDAYMTKNESDSFGFGLYLGILMVSTVICLLVGIGMKSRIMLAYASHVLSLIALYAGGGGYVAMYLPDSTWASDAVTGAGFIGGVMTALYLWRVLLNLKSNFPSFDRIYAVGIVVCICLLPFVCTPYYRIAAIVVIYIGMFQKVATTALLHTVWKRKKTMEMSLYFLASMVTLAGVIIEASKILGWLPQGAFGIDVYKQTAFIHILVMNAAMGLHVRQVQIDRNLAKQDAEIARQRAEDQRRTIALLTHEFRTPLTAISRSLQMIRIKGQQLSDTCSTCSTYFTRIGSNLSSLYLLVDNFLASEALDNETLTIDPAFHQVAPIIKGTIQNLGDEAERRVHLTITPDDAAYFIDPVLFGMAIGNLISNALRYSPSDTMVFVDILRQKEELLLKVNDHGPGLSEDEMVKLGTPFYRASTSIGTRGSGLGFSFCRRIVELHGGEISLKSAPGQGLEVTVKLCSLPEDQM